MVKTIFGRLACAVGLSLTMSSAALASAVTLLDTFPVDSATPYGPDAGLAARVLSGQEIAIPFTVNMAGRVRSIDTGIRLGGGLCGWQIGVMRAGALLGSTIQPGFGSAGWLGSRNVTSATNRSCLEVTDFTLFGVDAFVNLTDLDWALDVGEYLLVAAWKSDMEEARWLTNAALRTDTWAVQTIGIGPYSPVPNPCGGAPFSDQAPWSTLRACGLGAQATPLARVNFETNLGIPEPASLALVSVALAALGATARRRQA